MDEKRPKIKLNYSTFEKAVEIFSVILLIFSLSLIIIYWAKVPDQIATHFNFAGKPDSFGGKTGLLIVPIIGGFLYILLTILSQFPHTFNYSVTITEENAEFQYRNARVLLICMKAEITIAFTYILKKQIFGALGRDNNLGIIFLPIFLILLFGTLAYYIRRSVKYNG